jgi:co-chaperonin GroES (HSP10)
MTANQIQSAILKGNFTDRELRDINGTIVNILKADRRAKTAAAKRNFRVGDKVTFQHKTGTITKINRTKCVVETGEMFGGRWTVPMTMLKAA